MYIYTHVQVVATVLKKTIADKNPTVLLAGVCVCIYIYL